MIIKSLLTKVIFLLNYLVVIWFLQSCTSVPDQWVLEIPKVGFASSAKAIDLNLDATQDLVIGGGGQEFARTAHGVTAINGKDGSIMWSVPARNQMVGSAIFLDISADGFPDVIIGGRSAVLMAINGRNGQIIWEYLSDSDDLDLVNDPTLLNFFNPQLIPDIDGDMLDDLLISFGGFVKAKPEELDRPAGSLMIISSQNGTLLKRFLMPDGAETYMSPLVHDFKRDGNHSVIFGTGGEKMNGHLYRISLKAILDDHPSEAEILANGQGKGFIAPPVLVDVNLDGIPDIVANPVNGHMICLNGTTGQQLWEVKVDPEFEVYTTPAPGYFYGSDKVPDFFSSMGAGPWPDTRFTLHIMVDGTTGEVVFSDTLGLFQYASPVVFDYNDDGLDDILLAINDKRTLPAISDNAKFYVNELKILDFTNSTYQTIGKTKLGSNLGATPLLTDLDHDQRVDLIYCYMEDANNFYSFQKGKIERTELNTVFAKPLPWGSYMGLNSDGFFEQRPD